MKVALLKESNIIITGYKGYIASNFLKQRTEWVEESLDSIDFPCTIIHLAANANIGSNDVKLLANNISCDLTVIDAVKRHGHRIVYASTNNVYNKQLDCKVTDSGVPSEQYGLSKFLGEHLLFSLPSRQYIILRLADVFGRGQSHGNFFKAIEKKLLGLGDFTFSNRGDKLRSYIYIEELIFLLDHVVDVDAFDGGIYNICHNDYLSLFDIHCLIMGSPSSYSVSELNNCFDYRTMKQSEVFGYKYKFDLKDALISYSNDIRNRDEYE